MNKGTQWKSACASQLKHGRHSLFIDSCGGLRCNGREEKLAFFLRTG